MAPLYLLFMLIGLLAPVGTLLFLILLVAAFTERFGALARGLLRRSSVVGLVIAALAAVALFSNPDLWLPGPGNYAVVMAVFFAGFAAGAAIQLALRSTR